MNPTPNPRYQDFGVGWVRTMAPILSVIEA
jgi:hypothetical protein